MTIKTGKVLVIRGSLWRSLGWIQYRKFHWL